MNLTCPTGQVVANVNVVPCTGTSAKMFIRKSD